MDCTEDVDQACEMLPTKKRVKQRDYDERDADLQTYKSLYKKFTRMVFSNPEMLSAKSLYMLTPFTKYIPDGYTLFTPSQCNIPVDVLVTLDPESRTFQCNLGSVLNTLLLFKTGVVVCDEESKDSFIDIRLQCYAVIINRPESLEDKFSIVMAIVDTKENHCIHFAQVNLPRQCACFSTIAHPNDVVIKAFQPDVQYSKVLSFSSALEDYSDGIVSIVNSSICLGLCLNPDNSHTLEIRYLVHTIEHGHNSLKSFVFTDVVASMSMS